MSAWRQLSFRSQAWFWVLLAFFSFGGCKKAQPARPTSAKIHSISREFADAARSAGPPGTLIRVTTGANNNADAADHVDIAVPASNAAGSPDLARIQRALGTVATRNELTEEPAESREGILLYYSKSGSRTHAIHIHISSGAAELPKGTLNQGSGARLALIMDDLGSDRAAAEEIFELPFPVTISVLPNHEHSAEIAHEALRRGLQVMLHLPMQAVATEKPEAQELSPGMPTTEVTQMLDGLLQSVPGAVGVNNHQGSRATSDPVLMGELMPALRDRHLFYIDSRTTAATVAYEAAQSSGVPSAFRNVPFLDDVAEIGPVRKQLDQALRGALAKGQAVAIGHPHSATLQALREFQAKAQAQGVRLVFVSELVH